MHTLRVTNPMGIFNQKNPTSEEIASLLASNRPNPDTPEPAPEAKPRRPTPRDAVSLTILQDQLNQLKEENIALKAQIGGKKLKEQRDEADVSPHAALDSAKAEIAILREKIAIYERQAKEMSAALDAERSIHKKEIDKLKRDFNDIEVNLREEISSLRDSQATGAQESTAAFMQQEGMQQERDEQHSVVLPSKQEEQSAPEEASEPLDINELLEELERNPPKDE